MTDSKNKIKKIAEKNGFEIVAETKLYVDIANEDRYPLQVLNAKHGNNFETDYNQATGKWELRFWAM